MFNSLNDFETWLQELKGQQVGKRTLSLGQADISLEPSEEQRGFLEEAVSALGLGAVSTLGAIGGTAEMLGIPGGKTAREYWEQVGQRESLGRPEYLQEGTVWEHPERLVDWRWWTRSLAENAPNMAAMMLPGLGAMKGARLLGWGAKAIKTVALAAGWSGAFTVEAGYTYNQAKKEMAGQGYSDQEIEQIATMEGLTVGVINGILEILPFKALFLDKIGAPRIIRRIIRQAWIEGTTETAQEAVNIYVEKLGHKPDQTLSDNIGRLLESGIIGGALGGGAGLTLGRYGIEEEGIKEEPPIGESGSPDNAGLIKDIGEESALKERAAEQEEMSEKEEIRKNASDLLEQVIIEEEAAAEEVPETEEEVTPAEVSRETVIETAEEAFEEPPEELAREENKRFMDEMDRRLEEVSPEDPEEREKLRKEFFKERLAPWWAATPYEEKINELETFMKKREKIPEKKAKEVREVKKGRELFTEEQLAEFDRVGVDVSDVTEIEPYLMSIEGFTKASYAKRWDAETTKRVHKKEVKEAIDKGLITAHPEYPELGKVEEKKGQAEIIPYSKELDIRNIEALPRGTGAKYLEVIKGEKDEYIAKQWRRKPGEKGILIDFEAEAKKKPTKKKPSPAVATITGKKRTLEETRIRAREAETKAREKRLKFAASQKHLVPWIAASGGIWEVELAGEINDIIYTLKAGKKVLRKGVMRGFKNKTTGRTLDLVVRDAREAGFDVRDTDHLLELIEKDLKSAEIGDIKGRVGKLTTEPTTQEEFIEGLIENGREELRKRGLSDQEIERTIEEGSDTARITPEDEVEENAEELSNWFEEQGEKVRIPTQETLIKKEAPFELKPTEAPPKLRGRVIPKELEPLAKEAKQYPHSAKAFVKVQFDKKPSPQTAQSIATGLKQRGLIPEGLTDTEALELFWAVATQPKAKFPTEKIRAATRGEQVSLLPKEKGEQISLEEAIEEKGITDAQLERQVVGSPSFKRAEEDQRKLKDKGIPASIIETPSEGVKGAVYYSVVVNDVKDLAKGIEAVGGIVPEYLKRPLLKEIDEKAKFDSGVDKVKDSEVQYVYDSISKEKQYSLFDFKPTTPARTVEAPETGEIPAAQRVRVHTTGNIKASGTVISGIEDAASVLASIRKKAQEDFYSIAVDKDGTILEIHRYSKGTKAAALVSSIEVSGRALNIPTVNRVYLVHNHPTGQAYGSREDIALTFEIENLLEAGNVRTDHLVIGGTKYAVVPRQYAGREVNAFKILPMLRKISVPIKERYLVSKAELQQRDKVTQPADAIKAFETYGNNADGVLFIDTRNKPITFLPFIKGRSMKQTTKDIIKVAESSNAAAMVVNNNTVTPARTQYIETLARGSLGEEFTVLDVIENGQSWVQERGMAMGKAPMDYTMLLGETKLQMEAFHGTPYEFDQFTTEAIGKGEGAQAFGWGLYFTDQEDIGRFYADQLAKRGLVYDGDQLSRDEFIDKIASQYGEEYRSLANEIDYMFGSGYLADQIVSQISKRSEEQGKIADEITKGLQRVSVDIGWNIAPKRGIRVEDRMSKKDKFLLFDIQGRISWYRENVDAVSEVKENLRATVKAQEKNIIAFKERESIKGDLERATQIRDDATRMLEMFDEYNLVAKYLEPKRHLYRVTLHKGKTPSEYNYLDWHKPISEEQFHKIQDQIDEEYKAGDMYKNDLIAELNFAHDHKNRAEFLYRRFTDILESEREASLLLLRAGIDGIKYKTGTLSGIEAKGYNYVVFDESTISIEDLTKFAMEPALIIEPEGYKFTNRQQKDLIKIAPLIPQWLKKAGADEEILKNVTVELKPFIDLRGKKVDKTLQDWAKEGIDAGTILGATTFGHYHALMQLAINGRNLAKLERSTYHEWYHIAKAWMLPQSDIRSLRRHFKTEESEADGFANYMKSAKTIGDKPSFIKRLFLKLKRMLSIIRNGLKVKGFARPEDIFGSIRARAYKPIRGVKPATVIAVKPETRLAKEKGPIAVPTLEDIQRIFKGQEVTRTPEGNFTVTTQHHGSVEIRTVDRIDENTVAFDLGYGRPRKPGEKIAGKYEDGRIELRRDLADRWVLTHESYHFMEDAGIISKADIRILQNKIRALTKQGEFTPTDPAHIGSREDRALWIESQLATVFEVKSTTGKILLKIRNFIDRLLETFGIRTARAVARKIETGRIFESPVRIEIPADTKVADQPFYAVIKEETGQETAKAMEENRSFVNKLFEMGDLARHRISNQVGKLQLKVQELAGKPSRKRIRLGIGYQPKLKRSIASDNLDRGMMLYRDLQNNPDKAEKFRKWADERLKDRKTPASQKLIIKKQMKTLDGAHNLTDQQKEFVSDMGDLFEDAYKKAKTHKVVQSHRDYYVRRLWNLPKEKQGRFQGVGNGYGFKTFTTAAMPRTFETILDGWMNGYDLKVQGLTSSYDSYMTDLVTIIANKAFIQKGIDTKDSNGNSLFSTRQLPGYQALKATGFSVWRWAGKAEIEAEFGDDEALIVDTYGRKFFATPPERIPGAWSVFKDEKAKRPVETFDSIVEANTFARDKGYTRIERNIPKDVSEIFQKQALYAPASLAEMINKMTATDTWVFKIPVIKHLLRLNSGLKSWILLSSFFHHMAGTRSWIFGVHHGWKKANPVKAYKDGLAKIQDNHPLIELGIKNGLTLGELQDWAEHELRQTKGLAESLVQYLGIEPLDKAIQYGKFKRQKFTDSLFKKFFAGLKAEAFVVEYAHELQKEQEKYTQGKSAVSLAGKQAMPPNPGKIAENVARLINADFGGLHLPRMGRNPTLQNIFRLLLLAPDWTESNFRTVSGMIPGLNETIGKFMGDVAPPPGLHKIYQSFWFRVILRIAGITVISQMLLNGKDETDEFLEEQMLSNRWNKFRWTELDVSRLYTMLGIDTEGQRMTFSLGGHFFDPLKLIDPPRLIKHKGSPMMRIIGALGSKSDWAERPFTAVGELFKTGKTIKKSAYQEKEGFFVALPSIVVNQVVNMQPIQLGHLIRYLQGEEDGLTAMMHSMGAAVHKAWRPRIETPIVRAKGPEKDVVFAAIEDLVKGDILHMAPPSRHLMINGIGYEMTREQYEKYLDDSSAVVRRKLSATISSDRWRYRSERSKLRLIIPVVKNARKRVRGKIKKVILRERYRQLMAG